jgi:hypothetical protein
MELDFKTLKRLGFRPKQKNKHEMEVHVEVHKREYISISILNNNNSWSFSGLEVEGPRADEIRKQEFITFDIQEILDFLNKY